ncbi:MAG: hypothetical protein E3J72_17565 [Planctomycetota bacterium]|nr:MAG: hypothetical protein E3J72_17565 [Planctomycetota bacterium]
MALYYLTVTGTVTDEFKTNALANINLGYQKLLNYEVWNSGGFSWWGNPPPYTMVTAYGLELFTDMAKVAFVDNALITRVQNFLVTSQGGDGAWSEAGPVHYPSTLDKLITTAYVTFALAYSGYTGAPLNNAIGYLRAHKAEAFDVYQKAMLAQAFIVYNNSDADGLALLDELAALVLTDGDGRYWTASSGSTYGVMHSRGVSLTYEVTGRIASTMLRAGVHSNLVQGAIDYFIANKDSRGAWQTTQASVNVLRTLILAQGLAGPTDVDGTVSITINGVVLTPLIITPADADVLRIVSCTDNLVEGLNNATCSFSGTGTPLMQIVWTYYRDRTPPPQGNITIAVNYSKTTLTLDETTKATVTIANIRTDGTGANIVVGEIGLPPGFIVDADDLEAARLAGTFNRFEINPLKLVVYRTLLSANTSFTFSYDLEPTVPCKVLAPSSIAYEYYAPENGPGKAGPVLLTVTE